jgi:ZIP family zinc transporter
LKERQAARPARYHKSGGGCAHLLLETGTSHFQIRKQSGPETGPWIVYIAVATDLFADGLLIGAGTAMSYKLPLPNALGPALPDISEGFSVIALYRNQRTRLWKCLLLSAFFFMPALGVAVLAYFALCGSDEVLKMIGLVFVAGMFTLAAVEDMLREAHQRVDDTRWCAISFLMGFALFLVVSVGFK